MRDAPSPSDARAPSCPEDHGHSPYIQSVSIGQATTVHPICMPNFLGMSGDALHTCSAADTRNYTYAAAQLGGHPGGKSLPACSTALALPQPFAAHDPLGGC